MSAMAQHYGNNALFNRFVDSDDMDQMNSANLTQDTTYGRMVAGSVPGKSLAAQQYYTQ